MARRWCRPRLMLLFVGLTIAGLSGCVPVAIAAACVGACATATAVAAIAAREPVATLTLEVDGLACASCSESVRDALRKVEGVEDAQVNASEKLVTVVYLPSKVTRQQLIEALNGLGYSATIKTDAAQATHAGR